MIHCRMMAGLCCIGLVIASPALTDPLRIATYNIELTRDGPGLVLRDIRKGQDAQVRAISEVIERANPDILALQGMDYDFQLEALTAFNQQLARPYTYVFALPTNRGLRSGLDANGNGRVDEAADAQGYGRFYGQGAMALLSRYPVEDKGVEDFTDLLWINLPGVDLPRHPNGALFPSDTIMRQQRLSSSGHWIVPVRLSDTVSMSIMMFHATPPVFDGPEDRNGLRNAAEISLWFAVLDGTLGQVPAEPFAIAGSATLDPYDSDGRNQVILDFINDARLQDPKPQSPGAAEADDQGHIGQNALDTVDWTDVGRLRVDYVLPSADLTVVGSGVFWPAEGEDGHHAALGASRHRLVWVDVIVHD